MADIKVVIDTVLNEKGLRAAGQGIKSFGATLGIAAGVAYAFNAALDKTQERLEAIGEDVSAKGIEDAQQAWTALADTLLSIGQQTGLLDWMTGGLKQAAETLRQISILSQLFVDDMMFATGQITAQQSQANQIAIVGKAEEVRTKSIASNTKDTAKSQKDITSELLRRQGLQNDLEDALAAGDSRAIRKAQIGLAGASSNITLTIKSDGTDIGDWMAQAMTNAEISGARTDRQR